MHLRMIKRHNSHQEIQKIKKEVPKLRKESKEKKGRKATEYYVVLLIIRTRAVQAAMKIAVNQMKILNLIRAKKKVKVLMKEVRLNKKELMNKRRLSKEGLLNKK